MMHLWRLTWSHALGVYWLHCRGVTAETADSWKRIFESDDGALYVVSAKKPPLPDDATSKAMHPAMMN